MAREGLEGIKAMVSDSDSGWLRHKVTCSLLSLLVAPVCVSASVVGVKVGDWWQYGSLGFGFYSDNPNATVPPELVDTGLAWYRLDVMDITGPVVALDLTIGFTNGTEVTGKAGGDLSTGSGNLTFFVFPAGLSKGGTLPTGAYLNDTVTRSYVGVDRLVNVINGTTTFMGTRMTSCIIFDKITGIMCEFSNEVSTTQGDWVTTISSTMELTETNAFRTMPIPESGIIGTMGLLSVLLVSRPNSDSLRGKREVERPQSHGPCAEDANL